MQSEKFSTKISHFDVQHYDHWSELMENLLRAKGLWDIVKFGVEKPDESADLTDEQLEQLENARLDDHKVKHYLFRAIDRTVFEQILDRSTSKIVWDSLKRKFGGNARVKKSLLNALRREFEVLEMIDTETITEYFARVMTVANKMRSNGETMPDSKVVEKILRTLTDRFTYVVVSIEESHDTETMSVDELQSTLVVHEQKFRRINRNDEQVLTSENSRNGGRGRGRVPNRGRGRGRGRQAFSKATVECFKCHKLGHFQYECPQWNKEANYAELGDTEELVLMATIDEQINKEVAWFLDSGCSNHMCGDKNAFMELVNEAKHFVKCGNNSRMTVVGTGSVRLTFNGTAFLIRNVYYVPELHKNLLSIGQLQERGLSILIKNGKCSIYHQSKGLIVQTTMTSNRMFILFDEGCTTPSPIDDCLHTTADTTNLWHQRFGHLHYKGLKTLQTHNMVLGLPTLDSTGIVCSDCFTGKQHRTSIPKTSKWHASTILELIHADICGPIEPISNSGKRYFFSLIDDYSRKGWVYLLSEKSEALDYFKLYKNMVEKETGALIKCLRTDRGGEFNSLAFRSFCDENGIKRQLTTTYTPQQNGVAERKNRTVMNMVRCMLSARRVPKTFWPEAVNWAFYLLNRCPTHAVKYVTPQEAWSGIKPSIKHLRIWGCLAHVHIPDAKRGKLDDKSFPCIMLGVSDESKGYRLFDPKVKRIVVSKDVLFEEEKGWDWGTNYKEQLETELVWSDDELHSDDGEQQQHNDGIQLEDNTLEDNTELEEVGETSAVPRRERLQPTWMQDYVSGAGLSEEEEGEEATAYMVQNVINDDPVQFEEAIKHEKWRKAMDSEMQSIEKNHTWELTDLPVGARTIGVKWIYKTKLNEMGEVDKYKARLVVKGYSQQHGIDFSEVFAPVARMDTVRLIVALAACKGWDIFQLDVKSAFLYGELNEEVYVDQPKGYVKRGREHMVYKLHKALYGLKQAPRAWFSRIEAHFLQNGFQKCPSEQTLFIKKGVEKNFLIVSIYVDDLIYTGNDVSMMTNFKKCMTHAFDMTDLGKMRFFLGIEVLQKPEGIFLCQQKYANDVLKRFAMFESKPVKSPIVSGSKVNKDVNGMLVDDINFKQIVGSLMYLTATRPDIMFSVSLISRYLSRPTELHLQAAKRILRYLKGTTSYGIFYKKGEEANLLAFTDSDYAGDEDDSKSTSGYVFLFSSGAVSWMSKKQPIVTLSSTEAEFVAAAGCACQAIWMKRVLRFLTNSQNSTRIMCDNSSTIKLSKNPVMHGRSKHIRVRFHFLRDLVKDKEVEMVYCESQEQVADLMTKALKFEAFEKHRKNMGMIDLAEIN